MLEPMGRRGFLRGVAGTAVAAGTLSGGAPGRKPQQALAGQAEGGESAGGRIKKAVKFHMVTADLSVEDKFKLIKDTGFDGVEYRRRDDIEPRVLLRASEKTDLPIHGVVNGSDTNLEAAVDLAEYLGGTSVLWVAGRVSAEMPYDVNYRETQDVLRAALPHAAKKEIPILVENVWNNFLLSPIEMARYLDELDHPYIGAYFDIGNVIRMGWAEQWIRILGSRIGKIDIKEYSREKQMNEGLRAGFDVPLGEGSVDWPAVRKALNEIGFTGWGTRERGSGGRAFLEEEARRIDEVLNL